MEAKPVTLRALELFCGIGGFAAAVADTNVRIVGALDQNRDVLEVYRSNFPDHAATQKDLERIAAEELAAYGADLWWMSPPCQPYSVRGARKDLDDQRARSLIRIADVFAHIPEDSLPTHIAVENVAGFAESEARLRLMSLFYGRGYRVIERLLCPMELGVPSRRPRYYLVASRSELNLAARPVSRPLYPLSQYVNPLLSRDIPSYLLVSAPLLERFGSGLRILEADVANSYTTCFTSGYGKSLMHAGSYLRCGDSVRRFAPEEIARLLHFPPRFRFPDNMPVRKKWHLVGNSLSVIAVREILRVIPGIALVNSEKVI